MPPRVPINGRGFIPMTILVITLVVAWMSWMTIKLDNVEIAVAKIEGALITKGVISGTPYGN